MTLVGVLSDTHGHLCDKAYAALADCDHIIHAGDIGDPGIIFLLEQLAPVSAVLGNNDFAEYGSSVQRFAWPRIDGVQFLVGHYPQDVRVTFAGSAALAPGDPLPDICVHGHTHVPRLEWGPIARPAQYVMNPGSATYPRHGSCRSIAKVELDRGRILSIRIEDLKGRVVLAAPSLGV